LESLREKRKGGEEFSRLKLPVGGRVKVQGLNEAIRLDFTGLLSLLGH